MGIAFECPGCGHKIGAREENSGKKGECPKCGLVVTVPDSQGEAPGAGVGVASPKPADNGEAPVVAHVPAGQSRPEADRARPERSGRRFSLRFLFPVVPWPVYALCGVVVGVLGMIILTIYLQKPDETVPEEPPPVVASKSEPAESKEPDIVALAARARRAVVLLTTYDAAGKRLGSGTGFLVAQDGKVITNLHVIRSAVRAKAKTEDGRVFRVIGVLAEDERNDLVVLKITGTHRDVLRFHKGDELQPGRRVYVVGSPLGLEGTVTEGIVSAVRRFPGSEQAVLQITAAISPGSSGSPVLDETGNVVGVVTLFLRQGQSLNFAVQAECAEKLLAEAEDARGPVALAKSQEEEYFTSSSQLYSTSYTYVGPSSSCTLCFAAVTSV